ncbi:hypothetical protein [Embleya sp. NPDC059259]|uniref:hypothetical protein n=1 Tax=unclassified Embleya TaxID=2699296 RepID=UPI0036BDE732
MARIRTIKPELFSSESLASVSVTAERTFVGLFTQADDHGRHRDHAAIIAGVLWPLRPEHTPLDVENDLQQLAEAGLLCRYTTPDGKRYLHIVTWHEHQKINRPSASRLPACPDHDASRKKAGGACGDDSQSPHGGLSEGSVKVHRTLTDDSVNRESAGRTAFREGSVNPHGDVGEGSTPGSRILDPGPRIFPPGGAGAHAPDTTPALVAEYVNACRTRPPESVLSRIGRETKILLDEGVSTEHIRAGLERLRAKGLNPSALPGLVNEVMNADRPGAPTAYRPWTNPEDPEAAYGGDL